MKREVSLALLAALALGLVGVGGCGEGRAPEHIRIIPAGATVEVENSQQFTCLAYYESEDNDRDHSDWVSPTWLLTPYTLGIITPSGIFTASTTTASGWLSADFRGRRDIIPITLIPGPLVRIAVSPSNVTLAVGTIQQFTATGYDQNDNVRLTPTWSVEGDIGSIDAAGVLSATAAGTGRVLATVGYVVGMASVTVVAPGG